MAVKLSVKGTYNNAQNYLQHLSNLDEDPLQAILTKIGYEGVAALYEATPKRTGKTASSWTFKIYRKENAYSVVWRNTNIINGDCIAMVIQYGHGTKGGGYVPGIDYINPALEPVFKNAALRLCEEVKKDA